MSLTLVGRAFGWLVAHSPRASLCADSDACATPGRRSVVSGYNSHQAARYSSLQVTVCEQTRMSADGQSPGVKRQNLTPIASAPGETCSPRAQRCRGSPVPGGLPV